ncbi:ATP synthase complex assembly protein ATP12 [Sporobolomyces salmoneus]|uniref:ATP synthase complex assembly protein ATP12 n=1 Tax=Sporobolomyces salmoneus TaxID=183962 RepID=UPI003171AB4C
MSMLRSALPKLSLQSCTRCISTTAARASASAVPQQTESQSKRAEKMMRRFWKTVALEKRPEDQYAVLLDKRTLKTPGGLPLLMPKERLPVTVLIAEEWENQVAVLKPHTLPMTSIVSRALDGLNEKQTRQDVVATLLKYLDTDTVCFHEDFPDRLVKLQEEHWGPLLDWVRKTFDVEVRVYEGILNTKQPDATILKLGSVVADYDMFKLAAFERAVLASKSYLIALGLVEGYFTVDEAAQAAHVEVQSQIDRWGEVEDTHDVDHQDVRVRLGSAALLVATQPQLA